MNAKFAKVVLPAALAVGSLGLGAIVTVPAGASTKVTHAAAATTTLSGTVAKVSAAKKLFWLKSGSKTYVVNFKKATFSAGSAASLVKGASVSATGKLVGKNKLTVIATSVRA